MYSTFRQWWKTWGTLPVWSWVNAAAFYRKGNFVLAKKYYESGLKRHPDHPASNCARIDLSYCLFKELKFEEAEKNLRAVIANIPTAREAYERLGKLHLWTGNYLEAAWVYKRALQHIPNDPEFVASFLIAVLENGGPGYLLQEAQRELITIAEKDKNNLNVAVSQAMLAMYKGNSQNAEHILSDLIKQPKAPLYAYLYYSQILLNDGKIANARRFLRLAMSISPNHPRILALMADSYLRPGAFYNPGYARQLATVASQNSSWLSPWTMHTLADAYRHEGDKMSALIIASKAKEVGTQRLGAYKGAKYLDDLIETLSVGTLG